MSDNKDRNKDEDSQEKITDIHDFLKEFGKGAEDALKKPETWVKVIGKAGKAIWDGLLS